jgi:dTDP-4-amino-4,6-dideoxy-D-galactose acyltransferase
MAEQINVVPRLDLIEERAEALGLYSPTSFLRHIPFAIQQEQYGTGVARRFGTGAGEEVLPMADMAGGQWLVQHLPWDTAFFEVDTYRLFTGLFATATSPDALSQAASQLRAELGQRGAYYAFSVVPAEDIQLIQALTQGGWGLIETRLNFYRPTSEPLPMPPALVRAARSDEASHLGRVSAQARNGYDRFHADPWFGEERAAAMLTRYAEAAVAGTYADTVLVPAEDGLAVDSFLAIGDTAPDPAIANSGYSRVLLTAVGPENRGWHVKLVGETVRRAAANHLSHVLMTTQATNRAVFRTCEKLGFRLGNTTHVFACHS